MKREDTRTIMIGEVPVGGKAAVSIQSMTNTDTSNQTATLDQANRIAKAGGELVRVAVPDDVSLASLEHICRNSPIPIIADIHYRYDLAIAAMEKGVSKVRINPGNLGGKEKFAKVVKEAQKQQIPLRIGVNSGSLEQDIRKKYGKAIAEAMVDSALGYLQIAESLGYYDTIVSLKASQVQKTVEAYQLMADKSNSPLHVGITEAGPYYSGTIKSAVGIGAVLAQGIGNTIRVSLTAPPEKEIGVAKTILQSLGLRTFGPEVVSCPTCARTEIDVETLSQQVEELVQNNSKPINIAVMGCVVNGPGEAREADIGVTGTKQYGVIFKKGSIIKKVKPNDLWQALKSEIDHLSGEETL